MNTRLDYKKVAPEGVHALRGLSGYAARQVDARFRALIELRVSQVNGCAFCLNLHTEEARAAGEDQQRLDVLSAWRETSFFSARERAALAWAEALTVLPAHGVPEEIFSELQAHFSEKEIVDLSLVVVSMNAWNRLSIGFQSSPPRRTGVSTVAES